MATAKNPGYVNGGIYAIPSKDKQKYYFIKILISIKDSYDAYGEYPEFKYANYFNPMRGQLNYKFIYDSYYNKPRYYAQILKETNSVPELPATLTPMDNFWFDTQGKRPEKYVGAQKTDVSGLTFPPCCGTSLGKYYFYWGEIALCFTRLEPHLQKFFTKMSLNFYQGYLLMVSDILYGHKDWVKSYNDKLHPENKKPDPFEGLRQSTELQDYPAMREEIFSKLLNVPSDISYYDFALKFGKDTKRLFKPEQVL